MRIPGPKWRMFPWSFDGLVFGIASSHGILGVRHANPVVKREEENRVFEPRVINAPGPERHHADPLVSNIHVCPPTQDIDHIHLSFNKPRVEGPMIHNRPRITAFCHWVYAIPRCSPCLCAEITVRRELLSDIFFSIQWNASSDNPRLKTCGYEYESNAVAKMTSKFGRRIVTVTQ